MKVHVLAVIQRLLLLKFGILCQADKTAVAQYGRLRKTFTDDMELRSAIAGLLQKLSLPCCRGR